MKRTPKRIHFIHSSRWWFFETQRRWAAWMGRAIKYNWDKQNPAP